jgi:hypothetical protein
MSPRRLRAALPTLLVLWLTSGCTYYPSVADMGGVRLLPCRAAGQ